MEEVIKSNVGNCLILSSKWLIVVDSSICWEWEASGMIVLNLIPPNCLVKINLQGCEEFLFITIAQSILRDVLHAFSAVTAPFRLSILSLLTCVLYFLFHHHLFLYRKSLSIITPLFFPYTALLTLSSLWLHHGFPFTPLSVLYCYFVCARVTISPPALFGSSMSWCLMSLRSSLEDTDYIKESRGGRLGFLPLLPFICKYLLVLSRMTKIQPLLLDDWNEDTE